MKVMPYMVTPTSGKCVLESVSWTKRKWDISLLFNFYYVFDHQNFFHHSILIKLVSPFRGHVMDGNGK